MRNSNPLSKPSHGDPELIRNAPNLVDGETTWYRKWYFETRVDEEFLRSERYGHRFSLLISRTD
jgi:hypothetical protein